MATVSDGNGNTAGYNYLANSPLVGQIAFTNNGALRMTTSKTYDNLNRLTAIQSRTGVAPVSIFNYQYNAANQRTQVTNTDSSHWVYQYDNLGQVISGKQFWADGTPVAGQQFTYNFDDIGNRKSTASGGDVTGANLRAANYTANNLNQYTSRDVPGYATVMGSANPNATVTVNLQRAVRHGSYFWDELGANNSGSPLYLSLTNLAVLNNGTNADIVATNVGNVFLSQTPETFGYDPDGNLTNCGRWNITWDAENRAISFTSLSSAPLASQKKVDCAYDFQGRRIQKIVSTNNGSAWIPVFTNKFVYDGWNLVAILDPQSLGAPEQGGGGSLLNSFQWGTDLSGSQQGAGGVGGLLSMTVYASTNAGTYFYSIDGNGNVAALVNAVNGTLGAQYEYGPFGEVIRQTGPMAKMNPIRFSTKYQDDESDLLYYGYRYYKPSTGIWASRDPIEERGGRNVYGFLRNDPLNKSDRLGLLSVGQHIPVDCHCGVSTVKIGEIEVISYERRVVATRGGAHIEVAFHKNRKQCCCCKGDRYNWKSTVIEDTNPQKGKKVPYTDAPPDSYPYYNPESETSGDVDFWDEPSDVSSELTDSNGNNRTVKVHIKTTLVCASGAGGGSFTDFLWGFQYFYDSNGQPQVDLWNP